MTLKNVDCKVESTFLLFQTILPLPCLIGKRLASSVGETHTKLFHSLKSTVALALKKETFEQRNGLFSCLLQCPRFREERVMILVWVGMVSVVSVGLCGRKHSYSKTCFKLSDLHV